MTSATRTPRADARRNREKIVDAASALLAERGASVQMIDIASQAGLGVGTVYRHFSTKTALVSAIVANRFEEMSELARAAGRNDDPRAALMDLLHTYLEASERDAAFRFALLGPGVIDWSGIAEAKDEFVSSIQPILAGAIAARALRSDFTMHDFVAITRGAMANMGGAGDWRRHLTLALEGVLVSGPRSSS